MYLYDNLLIRVENYNLAVLTRDIINNDYSMNLFVDNIREAMDKGLRVPAEMSIGINNGWTFFEDDIAKRFIQDRIYPPERYDARRLMDIMNVPYYDEILIYLSVNGRSTRDSSTAIELEGVSDINLAKSDLCNNYK